MIFNLSRRVQKNAQRHFLRFQLYNAAGVSLCMGMTVPLLALHYGASDTAMGLIYSAIHITGFFALVTPILFSEGETTRIVSRAWWARACLSVTYISLPWLATSSIKTGVLISIYFLFLTARAMGISAMYSVLKAIVPSRNLQSFIGIQMFRHHCATLVAMLFAYWVLRSGKLPGEEWSLVSLLVLGALLNLAAARASNRIPPTGRLTEGSMRGMGKAFRLILSTPAYREVAALVFLSTILLICVPYQINYLKRIAGYSSELVFLITIGGIMSAVLVSHILKVIGDYVPFRALLFTAHFLMAVLGLAWSFIPVLHDPSVVLYASLYAASFGCLSLSGTVINRLQAQRLPEEHSYHVSMYYLIVGVIASVLTLALLAGTAPLIPLEESRFFHPYSNAFLLWTLASFIICIFSIIVKAGKRLGFREDLAFLAPSNLITIYRVHRAEQEQHGQDRQLMFDGILSTGTRSSRQFMLERLASPDISIRAHAYRSLNLNPLPEAHPNVLKEAAATDSPLRVEAITSLGYLSNPESIAYLNKFLTGPDAMIRAVSIKSLLRLGAVFQEDELLDYYRSIEGPRCRYHILAGLSNAEQSATLMRVLQEELPQRPDAYWVQVLFNHTAQAFGRRESMIEIFDVEQHRRGEGVEYIFTETDAAIISLTDRTAIESVFRKEEHDRLGHYLPSTDYDRLYDMAFDLYSGLGVFFLWTVEKERAGE